MIAVAAGTSATLGSADAQLVDLRSWQIPAFGRSAPEQDSSMTINLLKQQLGDCHEPRKSKQSTRTMEQRQVDWSEIATKAKRNLGHSHSIADG
jgi:hypothetical protein